MHTIEQEKQLKSLKYFRYLKYNNNNNTRGNQKVLKILCFNFIKYLLNDYYNFGYHLISILIIIEIEYELLSTNSLQVYA